MNVGMISLGCSKNQVDSEMMLGLLTKHGVKIVSSLEESDIIIINTCAFITQAKIEALNEIENVLNNKRNNQKVIVCGCFAERYKDYLEKTYEDIDKVISISEYDNFYNLIKDYIDEVGEDKLSFNNKVLISSKHSPYVRIADGCNNHCAFCAIPLIRGRYVSRSMEDILLEIRGLVKDGAKEINLIAQDVSKYGIDNYHRMVLPSLIREIDKIDGIFLIRLYYLYPETITDELIETIKNSKHVAHYFDMPLQHASNKMLKAMNRHNTKEKQTELIEKIRKEIPDSVIRTTLMVGFPGEKFKDYKELMQYVYDTRFFHMGAFMYSKEEDTASFNMKHQVPKFVMKKRYAKLMELQQYISKDIKSKLIGETYEAIVDSYDEESFTYSVRNYMFAPDDVDSSIICTCPFENDIKLGDIVKVKILDASSYELYGEIVEVLK